MRELDYRIIAGLVTKAQDGSSDAFAELYALTYKRIYNYACHYLKDQYLAQDAVQEVYILALKNILKLKEPSLFPAWLNQISFRICYDMCKKLNQHYGEINPIALELAPDEYLYHNPEDLMSKDSEARTLQTAIQTLPSHEQQVIVLKYYNNMKLEDIADAMDCSKSTVKRYLADGRSHLESILKGGGYRVTPN